MGLRIGRPDQGENFKPALFNQGGQERQVDFFSGCLISGRPVKANTNPKIATMAPRIKLLIVMLVISLYPKAKGEAASQIPTTT